MSWDPLVSKTSIGSYCRISAMNCLHLSDAVLCMSVVDTSEQNNTHEAKRFSSHCRAKRNSYFRDYYPFCRSESAGRLHLGQFARFMRGLSVLRLRKHLDRGTQASRHERCRRWCGACDWICPLYAASPHVSTYRTLLFVFRIEAG